MKRSLLLRGWYGERIPVPDVPDPVKKTPAKKNTRRWCGGHVGREHVLAWEKGNMYVGAPRPEAESWMEERCTQCRKKFRYCYPTHSGFRGTRSCVCGFHV